MRQALGRGLDALIPSIVDNGESGNLKKIPIGSIRPNHLQPRKYFDPERLSELAQSIKEHGLAQPILVSQIAGTEQYELIAGERRWRASQLAGINEIEAIVRAPSSDRERLAVTLIENLQREDLNPIEEALGYLRLMKEFSVNQSTLSELLGKSKSAISNTLRLLDLPEEIQKALQFGQLTEGHARALLSIENIVEKNRLFSMMLQQGLSVREAEDYARQVQNGTPADKPVPPRSKKHGISPDEKALQEVLQQHLGTKVEIRSKNAQRGSITLHYYSLEDFDRLIDILKK